MIKKVIKSFIQQAPGATRDTSKFKLFDQQPNFAYSKTSFAFWEAGLKLTVTKPNSELAAY